MAYTFADAARAETTHTYTENGGAALNTTSDARLDLFSVIGALRSAEDQRIERLFEDAYNADPLFAAKILFYGRDIRQGLGERSTFRKILRYAAKNHPEAVHPNLDLIGVYGRYDDLYSLIDTPLENDMWAVMKNQWDMDVAAMKNGKATTLLGKWVKTADASSQKTRELGILTAKKLGLPVYEYKRIYRALRKHIGVVEQLMSQGRWNEIKYPEVPSRAMALYRKAFMRHDPEGMSEYLQKVQNGEEKINASALYPYDLVRKYLTSYYGFQTTEDPVVEAQWKQMVEDFGETQESAIVISDTSGSMFCDNNMPIASSVALGLLFATCNQGPYHNLFMEFSSRSDFIQVKGRTLCSQINHMMKDANWGSSTNLEGAFQKILDVAVDNHVAPEDMPKALIVISDMEIDYGLGYGHRDSGWSFHEGMTRKFAEAGYMMPTVVYWNVNSRHDVYHADANRPGCVLISGHSASSFKQVLKCVNMTPIEAMEEIINSDRYKPITIE